MYLPTTFPTALKTDMIVQRNTICNQSISSKNILLRYLDHKRSFKIDRVLIYFAYTWDIPVTDASATELVPTGHPVDDEIGI